MLTRIRRFFARYTSGLKYRLAHGWKRKFIEKLSIAPMNAKTHLEFGKAAFDRSNYFLACAELKTARWLGADTALVENLMRACLSKFPELETLDHNQYSRFRTLADEIRLRAHGERVSVLDVGGGEGGLSAFIPEADYCLAEPGVNGISGTNLPFDDRAFDLVVSCHVLEHIPVTQREKFLDQLLAKSRGGVILLNPYHVEGTFVTERLQLVLDLTGAQWAREHLECSLPWIDEMRSYAKARGRVVEIRPHGTMATALSMVFTQYFAREAGASESLERLNRFFNTHYMRILDSDSYPNAYLVFIGPDENVTNGEPRQANPA